MADALIITLSLGSANEDNFLKVYIIGIFQRIVHFYYFKITSIQFLTYVALTKIPT